jgi:hypothetical protein
VNGKLLLYAIPGSTFGDPIFCTVEKEALVSWTVLPEGSKPGDVFEIDTDYEKYFDLRKVTGKCAEDFRDAVYNRLLEKDTQHILQGPLLSGPFAATRKRLGLQ